MNTIKVAGVRNPVPISHIMYVIGNGNYSDVFTVDGKHILSSMTLKVIEEQSSDLVRIHKGALINPVFIQQAVPMELIKQRPSAPITMQDGRKLAVSRRRWEVISLLKQAGV